MGALPEDPRLLLPIVFGQGLATALTPCVYPLIPITVSIFGASEATRARAAALSGTYVMGIAITFSTLGVLVAKTGSLFGQLLSNVWLVGFVSLVFALFALSLFGAFEVRLPASLNQRLAQVGGKSWAGALGMGLVAGLIAAPCAGPIVGSILAYVAAKGSVTLGFVLLFTYSLGMGLPFFLVGTFAMALPKSGAWLEHVKSVLAIIMLVTALYLLKDAVPLLQQPLRASRQFVFAAIATTVAGLMLGAVHLSFHGAWPERLRKTVGVALVVSGLYGAVAAATLPNSAPSDLWLHNEAKAVALARSEHKPLLVDFRADWCEACKELERQTYPTPLFRREAARFVLLELDVTKDSDENDALLDKYGVLGLPAVRFIGSDGNVNRQARVDGFVSPEEMVLVMRKVQ